MWNRLAKRHEPQCRHMQTRTQSRFHRFFPTLWMNRIEGSIRCWIDVYLLAFGQNANPCFIHMDKQSFFNRINKRRDEGYCALYDVRQCTVQTHHAWHPSCIGMEVIVHDEDKLIALERGDNIGRYVPRILGQPLYFDTTTRTFFLFRLMFCDF